MLALAKEIISGRRLKEGDPELQNLITADLTELMQGADEIRAALCGNRVDLCSIINGRGGKCSEDCNRALVRILPKIGMGRIRVIIRETPFMSE